MTPHPDHFDHGVVFKHLVNQSMLDIDSSRISAAKITNQLLVRWRILEWLFRQNGEQRLCFRFQPGARQLLCIFLSLPGINEPPTHQFNVSAQLSSGVFNPSMIDSRMPGTERRCSVS